VEDHAPEAPSPGARPLWIPPELKFDELPAALQRAITEIVDPAYRELVLLAQNALERSMGLTYVHLLYLEIIEMIDVARDMARTLPRGEGTDAHQLKITRHLKLVAQKDRVAKFILDVEKFYDRAGPTDPLRRIHR
jgi:hypothetical protein